MNSDEPRFMLIDLRERQQVRLTTDEVQAALFIAERERRKWEVHNERTGDTDRLPAMR